MKKIIPFRKLTLEFYRKDALKVAQSILGKILVRQSGDLILSGKIVEVEAYKGNIDKAAHTFGGKTKRNEVMFEEGGLLYVYFTYGMHYCSNVVTGPSGEGQAVLLRGIEPISGIETMAFNRFGKNTINEKENINLTNGPAKICKAFGLDKTWNGAKLVSDNFFIIDQPDIPSALIVTTTRIGIKKSVNLPWRFYIKNNSFVSKK